MTRKMLFLALMLSMTVLPLHGAAAIEFADGKLVVHGKVQGTVQMPTHKKITPNQRHSYDFHNIRASLKLETMWHVYEGPKYSLNVYSILKNFYDKAYDIDSGYHDYVSDFSGHRGIKNELRNYNTFRDICRELYIEVIHPLFQVRLGKQVVSWGETTFSRMADIVNPLDSRGVINPIVPDFAEIKQGLWMARILYTNPDMWQNIMFEFLVIPDFQPTRVYPAGHHMMHPSSMNAMQDPNELLRPRYRDAPKTWGNPELGLRLRGFTKGFDWTLQYLHHRNDSPVTRSGMALDAALPALLGRGHTRDVMKYKFQHTFGATFNKPIGGEVPIIPFTSMRMSGLLLKGEFIWEKDRDINQQVGSNVRVREIDRYAGVLGWDCKIFLPYITPRFRNKLLTSKTQLFMEWVPDRHRNDLISPWSAFRKSGHHFAAFTQTFQYAFWHNRILPGFNLNYQLTDGSVACAWALIFKPTFKWTYSLIYSNYTEYGSETNNGDILVFDIIYEF